MYKVLLVEYCCHLYIGYMMNSVMGTSEFEVWP